MNLAILRLLLLLLALLLPAAGPPVRAQESALSAYRLEVRVDYDRASVEVRQTVDFRNRTGQTLQEVVFHAAPAGSGALVLHGASAQGQPVQATRDGSVLEVRLPAPLPPGERAEIGLHFDLNVPRGAGRFSAGPLALALGNWFPTLATHYGEWDRRQYTEVGDAFVTEVADFEVDLQSSVPVAVASTGRRTAGADGGTSFHLEARSVRDFALSLSPSYVAAETQVDGILVRAYAGSGGRSRLYAETAAEYLRWYGQQLGPYPYRSLTLAEVDLPASYGGMEYPGLVFLSRNLSTPEPFLGSHTETLIGHEVAHQWFYSLVGNDQIQDPWLDEAFATYLPYLYYRSVAPELFRSLWSSRVADGAHPSTTPPLNSTVYDFPDDGPYFVAVYRQGGLFLDELRQQMGDAAFGGALRDLVATFADELATPRAVLDLFQRHSTANLNPLYARYFTYGAYDPTPAAWRVETPEGAWSGSVDLFIGADFPLSGVEVWLGSRRLYAGPENALRLDLAEVKPGEHLLLVRVWDHRGAQFERARRIMVSPAG